MKIKSNDIDRVIEILQEFKGELKDQEYFEFKNKNLIKESFIIPEKFGVKAENEKNAEIIYPYTEKKFKQSYNISTTAHWEIYCVCEFKDGKIKIITNDRTADQKMPIMSPENFIKHIVNENL